MKPTDDKVISVRHDDKKSEGLPISYNNTSISELEKRKSELEKRKEIPLVCPKCERVRHYTGGLRYPRCTGCNGRLLNQAVPLMPPKWELDLIKKIDYLKAELKKNNTPWVRMDLERAEIRLKNKRELRAWEAKHKDDLKNERIPLLLGRRRQP